MFKSILSLSVLAAVASFVSADGPGGSAQLEGRQVYTNAEAFARGLPPLRPRHRGSRTWTAVKRQQSSVIRNTVLEFDDASFDSEDGEIPSPYQGVNLGCVYGSCGYEMAESYPRWTAKSSPNAMYFYTYGFPTFTNAAAGGTLRLKSLYCTQAGGSTAVQLTVTGMFGSRTAFTRNIACTPNGPDSSSTQVTNPPTFNVFNNLPAVDSLVFSAPGDDGGWTLDNISLSTIS